MLRTKTKRATKARRDPGLGGTIVQTISPECPTCGVDEANDLRFIEQELPGTAPNGENRTHVVWRRRRCKCGQIFQTIEHQFRS